VERLVALHTDPPGATAYLDGEKVGITPCEAPYTWYGTRDLVLELRGYHLVREQIRLAPPWWQIPPIDFITDALIPFTIRDRLSISHVLEQAPVSREERDEVLRRAEELRRKAGEP
jgi:hypothetical protein